MKTQVSVRIFKLSPIHVSVSLNSLISGKIMFHLGKAQICLLPLLPSVGNFLHLLGSIHTSNFFRGASFCIVIAIVWTIAVVNAPPQYNATYNYMNSSRNSSWLKNCVWSRLVHYRQMSIKQGAGEIPLVKGTSASLFQDQCKLSGVKKMLL